VITGLLSELAVAILVVSTLVLVLSQNWRWSIIALAFQYVAVFMLAILVWPLGLAAVKLVAGWMAGAVLGASQPAPELVEDANAGKSNVLFRLFVALLVWVLVFTLTPALVSWIPLPRESGRRFDAAGRHGVDPSRNDHPTAARSARPAHDALRIRTGICGG
jgi:hypothetical protein